MDSTSQLPSNNFISQEDIDKYVSQIKKIINHSISPEQWKQIISKIENPSFKSLATYVVNMQEIFYQNNSKSLDSTCISESMDNFTPSPIENPEARLLFVKNGLENIDRVLSTLEKIEYTKNLSIEGRIM